jgi:GntR family transcriptional repressor for pyruvate dehydrogenase complex
MHELQRLPASDKLTARSVKLIITLIRDGKLKRGEKLPPQNILAGKLGISRTALREAFRELSYRGIIDSQHGRGTYVSDNMIQEEETLEARLILERQTVALGTERATDQEIAALAGLCDEMKTCVANRDPTGFSNLDLEFHSSIAGMTHNRALIMLIAAVSDMMLYQQNIVQAIPGAMERAYIYHLEILAAMRQRRVDIAENSMTRHLEDVITTLHAEKCKNDLQELDDRKS